MTSFLARLLLGPADRAVRLILDDQAKIVMLDHWRLTWPGSAGCGLEHPSVRSTPRHIRR